MDHIIDKITKRNRLETHYKFIPVCRVDGNEIEIEVVCMKTDPRISLARTVK